MTNYQAPPDQQWAADQNKLLQRVSVLERRLGALVSGAMPVTSVTRPANPATGMRIYETDTGLEAYWSGTAWVYPPQVIRSQTLGGTTAFIAFSGLPAAFSFLRLDWRVHLDAGGPTDLLMQVDGATSALYLWSKMESASATQSNFHGGSAQTLMKIGVASATTAGYFSSGSLNIAGWSTATGYLSTSGTSTLFDTNAADYVGTYGDLYAAAGPHVSLKIYPAANNFVAGSQFLLSGVG